MIQAPGSGTARLLHRAILGAYARCVPDPGGSSGSCPSGSWDWGHYLGYPLGDRYSAGSYYRQNFQLGHIRFYPGPPCEVQVWYADLPPQPNEIYAICDHPP